MKGEHIKIAVESNPLAEFAIKPHARAMIVRRVRGLRPALARGAWRYTEVTDLADVWTKPLSPERAMVFSRDLVTVEDATRLVQARIDANAAHYAAMAQAQGLMQRLRSLGVACSVFAGRVRIEDLNAMHKLLDKVTQCT